jgi:hypothetical protein
MGERERGKESCRQRREADQVLLCASHGAKD